MTQPSAPALSPIKQALLKIDSLRRELGEVRHAFSEPIAVVGIGCRLPGGSNSAEQLWDMLAAGIDAVTTVPPDRWSDAVYDPRPGRAYTSYSRHGAFIDGVDQFDPEFFGMSAREARRIDPQQRLLLECSWRALEDARFTRESVKASKTGVFIGSSLDDYARLSELVPDAQLSYAQTSLGTARPFAAGRVSYLFGFHGPTVQLDTACSSSLTTTHLACQSLRNRECDLALTGGVNLMLSPEMTIALCELQALSPDGRCKTFDAGANGYVRGEGCGMVALMRLSDARAQKRPIRAVIRGSSINHDGRSNGMTAPNGRAQREVIRDALARAGVSAAEVDYVEAHGTGTALGDPIELRALHDVYCKDAGRAGPLHVGSIKTNIGHLEGAASVSALIKVVCALQQGELPKHLHFETPTPHVDWSTNAIRVVDQHMAWPASRPGRRVAAISSFGMSGTNAHLVIEAYSDNAADAAVDEPAPFGADQPVPASPQLFAISAHTKTTLSRALQSCADHVRQHPALHLPDFAHSLRRSRDTHPLRTALVASTREELLQALAQAETAQPTPGDGKLAFLFTGQGAQYAGMARQLYQSFPLFRRVFDECDQRFEALAEHSLVDVLWGDQLSLVNDTRYTQPALFAVEIALARLWQSWGVLPDVLMGHSVGEYAAACLAGVFSLDDAFRLIEARGRLMESLTPVGKMSAVFASAAEIVPRLQAYRGRVDLAGDNGPRSVVVSGDPAAVEDLLRELKQDGIETRALTVTRAFHSPLMEPMLEAFQQVAQSIDYSLPSMALVSNLSGRIETERFCDPGYWVEHVRGTVHFRQGMDTLLAEGVDTCIEVGPGKVLTGLARACGAAHPNAAAMRWLHCFDAQHDERGPLLTALAAVYASGRSVDWAAFEASQEPSVPPRLVALPPYPLEQGAYWLGARQPADRGQPMRSAASRGQPSDSSLLGRELHLPASSQRHFKQRVSLTELPLLRGHAVHGQTVLPGAAWVEMALDAAWRLAPTQAVLAVHELAFEQSLSLHEGKAVSLATVLVAGAAGGAQLDIHASEDADVNPETPWVRHCSARIETAELALNDASLAAFQADCSEPLEPDALYTRLGAAGLAYEDAFRSIRQLMRAPDQALGRIELDVSTALPLGRVIHPALLDNCLQVVAAALWDGVADTVYMPIAMQAVRCRPLAGTTALWCTVQVTQRTPLVRADLCLFDDAGQCVAQIDGLQLAAIDAHKFAGGLATAVDLHQLVWKPLPDAAPDAAAVAPAHYLLVGGGTEPAAPIEAQFAALLRGARQPFWRESLAPGRPIASDDDDAARFRAALGDFAQRLGATDRAALIYLWPQAEPAAVPASSEHELAQVCHAHNRFTNFWRAVHATDWSGRSLSVSVVTQAGQRLPGETATVVPSQAAAWGMARSLMHESGDTRVLLLDLPGADAASVASSLRAIGLALQSDESQFVLRAHALHVPRLAPRSTPTTPLSLADGAYLVTGGRGAIGTRVVEWLIDQRVPKIVSTSRQLPHDAQAERLVALANAQGVQLEFAAADIADAASVTQLFEALNADAAHPLKGVFHAAGTLEDGLLLTQPLASARKVLAPKVAGTLNLHRATAGLVLDHFVSFSSVVSAVGSPGQCAYGAANAYTDAVSQQRCQAGLAGHVMNWGLWAGDGMASQLDAQQQRRVEAFGLKPLQPLAAVKAMEALMTEHQGQSLVWRVDAPTLVQRSSSHGMRALLEDVALANRKTASPQASRSAAGLGKRLRGLPVAEREAALSQHLVTELASTLQIEPARVSPRTPLIELGLDSLMAAEFRNAIRSELDVDVPFGRLLEGATLNDIVRLVVGKLDAPVQAAAPAAAAPPGAQRLDTVSSEATFDVELESGQL